MNELRAERLQVMLSPEELTAVDDFRFRHRMPTRAAAVRELLRLGLASSAVDAAAGVKSSEYGVFDRGPEGHTQTETDAPTKD
ncbi:MULTISPECIES: hypothetical protein [unclassified Bradyrhizobium]|uniref:hypothetical protein n=1 Tax=unclassified Bradyrhizobium TaxID=2631580 RepID=UPI00247939A6|nr:MULTISPECIES: hypothetical protein [unclassified Bradyrhizobium]WGR98910.1 hypothetical protein MTX23_32725 [Bradyrhizobium sp. ISRA436]WGS05801.1 hypothetical protein MTX18_32745 [Bradyrhizobium sp. ISRA437]WGS12687.1 hypothetical protein MTX26_32745 [Bradyrhizobium sp. ISRA443]WGS23763.1 hypothetical protein MTX22_06840 [Bradyrhizobium sp. ISRA463]WGS28370.1 hypothetical protein MTX19_04685 [Bradyrhizobium sp. ISRA464]